MKANHYLERVYELLEQFDFGQLSTEDKSYVLKSIPEKEYLKLRDAIKVTESLFSNSIEPDLNDLLFTSVMNTNYKPNILIKILNHPVKFYQLVASVILILGFYCIKQYADFPDKNSVLPKTDTIYIQKTDTVHSNLADTAKIKKEKIIFSTGGKDNNTPDKYLSAIYESGSVNIKCPDTINRFKGLALKTDMS